MKQSGMTSTNLQTMGSHVMHAHATSRPNPMPANAGKSLSVQEPALSLPVEQQGRQS